MNDAELLAELSMRKALIVHCSRPGKADEGADALLFPDGLRNAIEVCGKQGKAPSCSVIWPGHMETFGAVGIVSQLQSDRRYARMHDARDRCRGARSAPSWPPANARAICR